MFLDHRRAVANSGGTAGLTPAESVASGGARPKVSTSQEDAVFKQKLRHMGKCKFLTYTLEIELNWVLIATSSVKDFWDFM